MKLPTIFRFSRDWGANRKGTLVSVSWVLQSDGTFRGDITEGLMNLTAHPRIFANSDTETLRAEALEVASDDPSTLYDTSK
jgi:hypothetical protein